MTAETKQEEFRPEPQLLMGAASVSVFAYVLPPFGLIAMLFIPGALVATSLTYLHRLSRWRRLAVVVYGSIANCGLFLTCIGGLTTISIYAGLASLGLAALCTDSRRGSELTVARAGAAFLVGAAPSLCFPLFMARSGSDFNVLMFGVLGLVLIWSQYFLHSRYLVAQTVAQS